MWPLLPNIPKPLAEPFVIDKTSVAGQCADDPLYLPTWRRMVEVLGRTDFLVVGDCKPASLENRAQIQAEGGYYLAPLAMTGDAPERLRRWVLDPPPI